MCVTLNGDCNFNDVAYLLDALREASADENGRALTACEPVALATVLGVVKRLGCHELADDFRCRVDELAAGRGMSSVKGAAAEVAGSVRPYFSVDREDARCSLPS